VNLLVGCLIFFGAPFAKDNEYVNNETITLGLLLCAETHLALQLERRRRDPFVILLAFTNIFFYSFRIFTLTIYPFSIPFLRYPFGPENSNTALVFIIVANVCLYSGLLVVGLPRNRAISPEAWKPTSTARVVLLMVVAILYAYLSAIYWTPDDIPRIVGYIGLFLAPNVILLMTLAYFLLYRNSVSKAVRVALALLILLQMVAQTLSGSRSAITMVIQDWMMVVLALASTIKFSRRLLVLGSVLVPALVVILVGTFTVSTFVRDNKERGASVDVGRTIETADESASELLSNSVLSIVLPPIFDRAGYFDFSAEIIAHREFYKSVINLPTYGKSIVDNLLTPGFDIYDQPKISNALQFIYNGFGTPSKRSVSDSYQSDQLGIYGELYGLFGYASLPLFFLVTFLIKLLYVRLRYTIPFVFAMKRVVVLAIFGKIVDSYGFDWTLIEAVPLVTAIFLYTSIFTRFRESSIVGASGEPAFEH
jgi:hypothetical protein